MPLAEQNQTPSSLLSSTEPQKTAQTPTHTPYRDNPDLVLPVTVNVRAPDRDDQLRKVAIQICPFLLQGKSENETAALESKEESLQVKPLLGGLSNELFIVSRRESPTTSVLVRIHPDSDNTNDVVDRDVEVRFVAWLSSQQMAPIFYGQFQNGRVEEFYSNVKPLSHTEMGTFGPLIAVAMADFHALDAPAHILPRPQNSWCARIEQVHQWMADMKEDGPHTSLVQQIQVEWKWLWSELEEIPETDSSVKQQALEFIREPVVTHMDCQSLNVLKDADGQIRLIDFEYAGWNPRAADVANTFCEYCDMNNLKADYEAEYPSEDLQNQYLLAYLERAKTFLPASPEFLATLRQEIGRFTLLSHLGWAAWSVLKAEEASSDFDYIAYAHHRMDGYKLGKAQFT